MHFYNCDVGAPNKKEYNYFVQLNYFFKAYPGEDTIMCIHGKMVNGFIRATYSKLLNE